MQRKDSILEDPANHPLASDYKIRDYVNVTHSPSAKLILILAMTTLCLIVVYCWRKAEELVN